MPLRPWLWEPAQDAYERERRNLYEMQLTGRQALLEDDSAAIFKAAEQIDEISRPPRPTEPEIPEPPGILNDDELRQWIEGMGGITEGSREVAPGTGSFFENLGRSLQGVPLPEYDISPERQAYLERVDQGLEEAPMSHSAPPPIKEALQAAGVPESPARLLGDTLNFNPVSMGLQGTDTSGADFLGEAGLAALSGPAMFAGPGSGIGAAAKNLGINIASGVAGQAGMEAYAGSDLPGAENPLAQMGAAIVTGGGAEGLLRGGPAIARRAGLAIRGADEPLTGTLVYHGTNGPLEGDLLRQGTYVTTNRADAEAFANATSRLSGGTPTVHEFRAVPGALEPAEEGLAAARGAVKVVDPSGVTPARFAPPGGAESGMVRLPQSVGNLDPETTLQQIGHPRSLDEAVASIQPHGPGFVTTETPALAPLRAAGRLIDPSMELSQIPAGRNFLGHVNQLSEISNQAEAALLSTVDTFDARLGLQRVGGAARGLLGIDETGHRVTPLGERVRYEDFMQNPTKYGATPEQMEFIRAGWGVIDWADDWRIKNGGIPYPVPDGAEHYWPRQVSETRPGIETRSTRNELPRFYDDATTGEMKGVQYGTDLRSDLRQYVISTMQNTAREQLDTRIAARAVSYSQLVPQNVVIDLQQSAARYKGVRQGIYQQRAIAMRSQKQAGQDIAREISKERTLLARQQVLEARTRGAQDVGSASERMRTRAAGTSGIRAEELARAANWVDEAIQRTGQRSGQLLAGVGEELRDARKLITDLRIAAAKTPRISVRKGGAFTDNQRVMLDKAYGDLMTQKRRYKEALDQARRSLSTKAPVFGNQGLAPDQRVDIEIRNWNNRVLRKEDVDVYRNFVRTATNQPPGVGPVNRALVAGAAVWRSTQAVADFATAFIQGLPVAGISPRTWAGMMVEQYRSFGDPVRRAQFMAEHAETAGRMGGRVTLEGEEALGGFRLGAEKGSQVARAIAPKVAGHRVGQAALATAEEIVHQPIGRFEASYQHALNYSRVKLWEALEHKYAGQEDALAEFINKATGGIRTSTMGILPAQRAVEGFWLGFSSRLLRSTVALAKDAMMGSAKFALRQPVGAEEALAARSLFGLAAGATTMYVASGLALGKSWEEIQEGIDPTSGKKFLSHEVNGTWYGVGGQVRALVQLGANLTVDLLRLSNGEAPSAVSSIRPQDNPLVGYWQGRASPALSVGGAVLEGVSGGNWNAVPYRDIDNPIDLAEFLGTSLLPFAAQAAIEGQSSWGVGAGMLGARSSEATPNERLGKLADQYMARAGAENPDRLRGYKTGDFYSALPLVRDEIKADYPEIWHQAVEAGNERRQKAEVEREGFRKVLVDAEQKLAGGSLTKKDYVRAEEKARNGLTQTLRAIYRDGSKFDTGNPHLNEYYQAVDKAAGGDPRAEPDWGKVEAWVLAQPVSVQNLIAEQTGAGRRISAPGTPEMQRALTIAKELKNEEYWTLPKYQGYSADQARQIDAAYQQVMDEAKRRVPAGREPGTAQKVAALNSLSHIKELDRTVRDGIFFKVTGNLKTLTAREKWRAAHPEAFVFEGEGPLTESDRRLIAKLLAGAKR